MPILMLRRWKKCRWLISGLLDLCITPVLHKCMTCVYVCVPILVPILPLIAVTCLQVMAFLSLCAHEKAFSMLMYRSCGVHSTRFAFWILLWGILQEEEDGTLIFFIFSLCFKANIPSTARWRLQTVCGKIILLLLHSFKLCNSLYLEGEGERK